MLVLVAISQMRASKENDFQNVQTDVTSCDIDPDWPNKSN
jgi:hypothetical protein